MDVPSILDMVESVLKWVGVAEKVIEDVMDVIRKDLGVD